MFYKTLVAGLLAMSLAGCQVTINSETEVVKTPSKSQERFPRGELVFACSTVAGIYEYLENGGVSAGCGYRAMTAARARSVFYTYERERFIIIEFREGFEIYYTYDERRWRRYSYRY
jgi:hypothetical protein